MSSFDFQQIQSVISLQSQEQKLSQRQIFAMKILSMNNRELRDEILKTVKSNPALEIVKDFSLDKNKLLNKDFNFSEYKTVNVSAGKNELSDSYNAMLESSVDSTKSLQEHLMFQLNIMKISEVEYELCNHLIYNLNSEGFHIQDPYELADSMEYFYSKSLVNKCIKYIQEMDPVGICCKDIEESLLVQSIQKGTENPLVNFILSGNLSIINPPITEKIKRKILAKLEKDSSINIAKDYVTDVNVENALNFIRTLEPRPARGFSSNSMSLFQNKYIKPDVYVTKGDGFITQSDFSKGLVKIDDKSYFRVTMNHNFIPKLQISKKIIEEKNNKNNSIEQIEYIKTSLRNAQSFIESIDFRNMIFIKACSNLVDIQKSFFQNGKGNLIPLTQKKFANMIDVHESTVSRMADSKTISCDWGNFRIKYFFTTGILLKTETEQKEVSSDTIRHLIREILDNQAENAKPLSDQKIADELTSRGYKIARRTVAKYRSQLNIGSSFSR